MTPNALSWRNNPFRLDVSRVFVAPAASRRRGKPGWRRKRPIRVTDNPGTCAGVLLSQVMHTWLLLPRQISAGSFKSCTNFPSINTLIKSTTAICASFSSFNLYPVQTQISLPGHSVRMRCTSLRISGTFCGWSGSPPDNEILALDAGVVEIVNDLVFHLFGKRLAGV
jgi:hypothetical protein